MYSGQAGDPQVDRQSQQCAPPPAPQRRTAHQQQHAEQTDRGTAEGDGGGPAHALDRDVQRQQLRPVGRARQQRGHGAQHADDEREPAQQAAHAGRLTGALRS
jgi:hypothetical protein